MDADNTTTPDNERLQDLEMDKIYQLVDSLIHTVHAMGLDDPASATLLGLACAELCVRRGYDWPGLLTGLTLHVDQSRSAT